MLWRYSVFRRGAAVEDLWDGLFSGRTIRLLYITGRGFDPRAPLVMESFVKNVKSSNYQIERAQLLMVGFKGYALGEDLKQLTERNAKKLKSLFEGIGTVTEETIDASAEGEDDIGASNALQLGTKAVFAHVTNETDIILDISSFPRVAYLALITGILQKLVPNKSAETALWASGVNFQVLVAEDAALDGQIRSEDPGNDLVLIPGFSSALHLESVQDWPLVWFPMLGENRVSQLEKILTTSAIPEAAEICPVLPHPSRNPRRADELLLEYKRPLFDARETPIGNTLYAHEANPFEAYRQLLGAMMRCSRSMKLLGGCRLVVTPLGSKLMTIAAGLACFEIRPSDVEADYGVAISCVATGRYEAPAKALDESKPELACLLLTGDAYSSS